MYSATVLLQLLNVVVRITKDRQLTESISESDVSTLVLCDEVESILTTGSAIESGEVVTFAAVSAIWLFVAARFVEGYIS